MPKARARRKATPPSPAIPMDGPTQAQIANGQYERASMPAPDGGNRVAQLHINRGGTPVARWIATGKLSDTQSLAIQLCYRLWALVGCNQHTTAAYGERVAGLSHHDERRAVNEIEARDDLRRIQGYIPPPFWQCFENVCRFDEPAGSAGSKLGWGSRSSHDRAHTVVCFVADTIAMKEGLASASPMR